MTEPKQSQTAPPPSAPSPSRLRRLARLIAYAFAWVLLIPLLLWSSIALWIDGPAQRWLAALFALTFLAGCVTILLRIRPIWRAMLAAFGMVLLVVIGWRMIPPRNDRDWTPDVAQLARAEIDGSRLTIHNVRNFDYRSENDATERWETRKYDLDALQGADMFISFWGPTLIAHTIASWDFADGPPLAISIETRKEKGESYSAVLGFFRQYELYYVVSDERDVVRLRTNFRGEDVYLYRMRMPAAGARAVLLDYLKEVNELNQTPRWYNALTQNCTTTIRHHALHVGEGHPWDWRILANGRLDQMGYERGIINTSLPFPELKARSAISERAKAADSTADFSAAIRAGLPERPSAPVTP